MLAIPLRLLSLLLCLLGPGALATAAAPADPVADPGLIGSLPLYTASPADVARAMAAIEPKNRPIQYAVTLPLPLTLAQGYWDLVDGGGTARWRLRVRSDDALGISLSFARFHLPEGAALWLYDEAATVVQGPYTRRDHTPEGRLWTALVPGAAAVVELRVPAARRAQLQLELGELSHAFRDLAAMARPVQTKALGDSGSCNIDVICPDGDAWRREIRSVALLSIGGSIACSGQLLNNVRQNEDPLLITANHCRIGQPYSASSVVAYWNFHASSCGGSDGSLNQSQSGSTLLASDTGSDFTLLRLRQNPPDSYDLYFAGWDAGSGTPQSGVSIHHPSADVKSISTYSSPATRQTVCIESSGNGCSRSVEAWLVNWARGTTEQGSSGGGLWNQHHRLVGVLSGGNASCDNPGGEDYYGRLDVAFTASASASGQLKAWLDPDNTGTTAMDGLSDVPPPLDAIDDAFTVAEDAGPTSFNVVANDTSTTGAAIQITAVGATTAGGTATLSSNRIVYTPAANFTGTDTFTYTVGDGNGSSDTAVVTVSVQTASASGDSGGGGAAGAGLLLPLALLGLAMRSRRRG